MRIPFPKSLPGQIALLVAVALFVAQAINFALLLSERRQSRLNSVIVPAVTRLVDVSERLQSGRMPLVARLRVGGMSLEPANPVPPQASRRTEIEQLARNAFAEAGVTTGPILATVLPVRPDDPRLAEMPPRRKRQLLRLGGELVIASEQAGFGWLTARAPWPRMEQATILQLIAQTLILYGIVLVPVLFATRRMAQPLGELAAATRRYRPGARAEPLRERGPGDVRSVIAAFNALSLRIDALIDEKDRMLGAIGHDLRTPLAALRVRIESVDDEADRTRMADIIDEMNRTLEDILSLARLGRSSEAPAETDIGALVDAAVEDFRDLGAPVTLADPPRVTHRLKPGLMRRAVRNLIENAVKYGGGAEVSLRVEPRSIGIEVADRGPGIPADQLASVFDPFTRLETSRNRDTGGIGLGLAIARAIAEEAGGAIELRNRDGGGLLATIRLPR